MLEKVKFPFVLIWKLWFVLLNLVLVTLLYPYWYWASRKEENYSKLFRSMKLWAWINIFAMGWYPRIKGSRKAIDRNPKVIISNHTSIIDIITTLAVVPGNFVFVGKASIAKLPMFGKIFERSSILVDRSSLRSRAKVMIDSKKVIDRGLGICLFPEGGIPKDKVRLGKFKHGAFSIAAKCQVPILPLTYVDNKRKFPYAIGVGGPGRLRVQLHEPISVQGKTMEDVEELRDEAFQIIDGQLSAFGIN